MIKNCDATHLTVFMALWTTICASGGKFLRFNLTDIAVPQYGNRYLWCFETCLQISHASFFPSVVTSSTTPFTYTPTLNQSFLTLIRPLCYHSTTYSIITSQQYLRDWGLMSQPPAQPLPSFTLASTSGHHQTVLPNLFYPSRPHSHVYWSGSLAPLRFGVISLSFVFSVGLELTRTPFFVSRKIWTFVLVQRWPSITHLLSVHRFIFPQNMNLTTAFRLLPPVITWQLMRAKTKTTVGFGRCHVHSVEYGACSG